MNADKRGSEAVEDAMNEDFYSTACRHADGTVTEVRVRITPEARKAIEEGSGDPEEMMKSCVWRSIALKHELKEVKGYMLEFTIDEPMILKLLNDLREIQLTKREVCRDIKS